MHAVQDVFEERKHLVKSSIKSSVKKMHLQQSMQ